MFELLCDHACEEVDLQLILRIMGRLQMLLILEGDLKDVCVTDARELWLLGYPI